MSESAVKSCKINPVHFKRPKNIMRLALASHLFLNALKMIIVPLVVDRLLDAMRTAVNIFSDAVGAVIIAA